MKTISANTTRLELAAIVVAKLQEHDIRSAVLVGGSVVSLYTNNKYETRDLDFISSADHKKITSALAELGFVAKGKDFVHPDTQFSVEFPSGPLGIGDDVPILPEGQFTSNGVHIKSLSATQCVMDRLINFFIYDDRQCLQQAIWVASSHEIDHVKLADWATKERQEAKLKIFLNLLNP